MPFLLPKRYAHAHDLCFFLHGLLLETLLSGQRQSVFNIDVHFRDAQDRETFETNEGDILDWLAATGRTTETKELIRRVSLPALLSDFCNFIYEALRSSGKGKLTVAFALLRKPLQETLFVFEAIAEDPDRFSETLAKTPQALYAPGTGGVEAHRRRISRLLPRLHDGARYDAAFIAQLRYDKSTDDGFDGISNKALHLFTGHEQIRTEPMNINFVFSDANSPALETQWAYLYARLPYLLAYTWDVLEVALERFCRTDPKWTEAVRRRLDAGVLAWESTLADDYREPRLARYAQSARRALEEVADKDRVPSPSAEQELVRVFDGEWGSSVRDGSLGMVAWRRMRRFRGALRFALSASRDEFRRHL